MVEGLRGVRVGQLALNRSLDVQDYVGWVETAEDIKCVDVEHTRCVECSNIDSRGRRRADVQNVTRPVVPGEVRRTTRRRP